MYLGLGGSLLHNLQVLLGELTSFVVVQTLFDLLSQMLTESGDGDLEHMFITSHHSTYS